MTFSLHHLLPILICTCYVAVLIVNAGFACLSNPCVHGVCMDSLNGTTTTGETFYSCYCIDGYTGVQCQTNWDECWSAPCKNGGICIDGIASYNCSCPSGFVGEECEEDIDECQSNPCRNNGTCIDASNGYVCHCLPGYSGSYCEIDVAVCNTSSSEARCSNGGMCLEGPGYSFSCKCLPGWTGFLCDFEVDECLSAPCQNGAVCVDLHADYACACVFGYTGRNCDEVIMVCDQNPCENAALCLMEEDHPTCYCVPDYHGDRCQYKYDECQLGPRCLNGGTCIDGVDDFTCSCLPNRVGVICELYNNRTTTSTTESSTITIGITDEITTQKSPVTSTEFTSTIISTTDVFTDFSTLTEYTTKELSTTTESITSTIKETIPTTQEITSTTPQEMTTIVLTTEEEFTTSPTSITNSSTDTTRQIDYSTTIESTTDIYTTDEITSTIFDITATTLNFNNFTTITTNPPSAITESSTETTIESTTIIDIPTTIEDITSTVLSTTEEVTTVPITVPITIINLNNNTTTIDDSLVTSTVFDVTSSTVSDIVVTSRYTDLLPDTTTEKVVTSTESITASTFFTEVPISTIPPNYTTTSESVSTTDMTTEYPESTTSKEGIIYVDCTKSSNRCQNGGTCVYTEKGYNCVCPFNAEGPICNVTLGIKHAAFNGKTYLAHRLMENNSMVIEFEVKTLANSGLIFYFNVYNAYMILHIENGYLKFKFSCGYQTMLLSELEKPINNGHTLTVLAEFWFDTNYTTCTASIKANNTLTMAGNQLALIDKLSKFNSWLYLGNIPYEHLKEDIQEVGFIGCMDNLKIGNSKVRIFKDAEDGFDVSECSSLACLSNPCYNGGRCIEKGNDWTCSCRYGYSGEMCQIFICETNPCQFGGTCLPYIGSGYICLCPLGKNGHYCENDIDIIRPNFSSTIHGYSSYLAHPLPTAPLTDSLHLRFTITPATRDQIALLLFLGQPAPVHHQPYTDHLAVSYVHGYVMVTWNLGGGARRIFTRQPVGGGAGGGGERSFRVEVGRRGRRAWLDVEGVGNVTGRSPGYFARMDVTPVLYIGGHPSRYFTTLPHDLPLHTGFSGCIYDVEFLSGQISLPLLGTKYSTGRALGQCGTTVCHANLCQHSGACLYHGGTFTCLCEDGRYGPLCSFDHNPCDSFINKCSKDSTCVSLTSGYECDCPMGKSGKFCKNASKLMDIKFTGNRSYLLLTPIKFETNNIHFEFEIKPEVVNGLVLFFGRKDSFVSMSIRSGLLEIRIRTGHRKRKVGDFFTLTSNKLLILDKWNKIKFGIYGRRVYLFVDNIVNTGIVENANALLDITGEKIYLGGLSDLSKLPYDAQFPLPVAYRGCLRHFSTNSRQMALDANVTGSTAIRESRNLADCVTSGCDANYCLNGGRCWLDARHTPRCSCMAPSSGEQCEYMPQCSGIYHCKNGGRCIGQRCSCTVGWSGTFCERSIVVKQPKFVGNSYLLMKKGPMDRKRGVTFADGLYFNFSTVNRDTMILWVDKNEDNVFLGVGLQNGRLKLILSSRNDQRHDIPYSGDLSDGLWHKIEFTFAPSLLKIDGAVSDVKLSTTRDIFTGNYNIYLGGLPPNRDSVNRSYKALELFSGNFSGCIDTFGTSKNNNLTDFSGLEGENVDIC